MYNFLHLFNFAILAPDDGGAGGSDSPTDQDSGDTDTNQGGRETNDQLKNLQTELEAAKKESSGKDKSVTRLQKELDELKKAQMSAEERKVHEETERQEKAAQERNQFLTEVRTIAAELAGLDEQDAEIIPGNTPEEIRENGKRIKDLLEVKYTAGFQVAKKETMNGGTPQGGFTPPTERTVKKLNDLFKS